MSIGRFACACSLVILGAVAAAAGPSPAPGPPEQGICGVVRWLSGNHMPTSVSDDGKPEPPGPNPPVDKPVEREVLVYKRCPIAKANGDGPFYRSIDVPLVATTKSGADGKFCVALPPGNYSLFVREGQKGLYANGTTDQHVYPVSVEAGKVTTLVFQIDYEAAY